jgi:hypothetical protein
VRGGPDEQHDPATLSPSVRRSVRLHQHDPGSQLRPWVFDQHQVWADEHGHEHEIESMPRAYAENVIAYCRRRALVIWVLTRDDVYIPDRCGPQRLGATALEWLEQTPLMRALRRRAS